MPCFVMSFDLQDHCFEVWTQIYWWLSVFTSLTWEDWICTGNSCSLISTAGRSPGGYTTCCKTGMRGRVPAVFTSPENQGCPKFKRDSRIHLSSSVCSCSCMFVTNAIFAFNWYKKWVLTPLEKEGVNGACKVLCLSYVIFYLNTRTWWFHTNR